MQTKSFPPQIKLIFKPTMSWTDSQQALVHVYTVNIYIRMYQNTELTSRIVEVQATSFILYYLPKISVYKNIFICSHKSVITEEHFSLLSLQVMIKTFRKIQNFPKSSI